MSYDKKVFSASDAAPTVLYAKKVASQEQAYPLLIDDSGRLSMSTIGYATPPGWQSKYDKDVRTDGQDVYIGFSPMGTTDATESWLIYFNTYDANGYITWVQSKENIAWSARTTSF